MTEVNNNHFELLYFHDPMCSWCWAYRPTWMDLKSKLTKIVQVRSVLGGLAPDSDDPMSKEMARKIEGFWFHIHDTVGTEFNHAFWRECIPRRSTYPACRAVIAARKQNAEEVMIKALQEAYYLRAKNPSDTETHLQLASELGLDCERYERDLGSTETNEALLGEVHLTRSLGAPGFPSLILINRFKDRIFHIPVDYSQSEVTLEQVQETIADASV